jgi:hypothetical protein
MPASMHESFEHPASPSARIWRYMDFTRFIAMLETSSLWFCRTDHLGDPFEGSISQLNIDQEEALFQQFAPAIITSPVMAKARNVWRQCSFMNCWYLSEHESAAMWRLYSKTNESIAIETDFSRLFDSLDESCFVGLVKYMDYEREAVPTGNLFNALVRKRLSYEHEKELRALYWDSEAAARITTGSDEKMPVGVSKRIKIDALILRVHVAPNAAQWFVDLVSKVIQHYGYGFHVKQSDLNKQPIF